MIRKVNLNEGMKMKMKWIVAALFVISGLSVAQAGEDDGRTYDQIARQTGPREGMRPMKSAMHYDITLPPKIEQYLAAAEAKHVEVPRECANFHQAYTRDGYVDIRYALGYFDDSTGHAVQYENLDWGLSPSYDEGVWLTIREIMTKPCPNSERRLCGFRELTSASERNQTGETVLGRDMEIHGKSVVVRFTLSYASASPFYERNKTELRDKQERYTRNSESNFFGNIRRADYVIYNGHSRNGGGPDFNPPRLNALSKADYNGYYRKAYPGRTRLLEEIRRRANPEFTLGLFSCDSDKHFRQKLEAASPGQRMMLTTGSVGILDYYDTTKLSLAYIDGLLKGSCGSALEDYAQVSAHERAGFKSYNMK